MRGFISSEIRLFPMLGSISLTQFKKVCRCVIFWFSASSVRGESLVAIEPAQNAFRTSSLRSPQVKLNPSLVKIKVKFLFFVNSLVLHYAVPRKDN